MQLSRIRLLPRVTTANVCRMRSSVCDTLARHCVRYVLCWPAFPLASTLRSTDSAADCSALFVGFPANMAESDFPHPYVIGYGSSPSRCELGLFVYIGQAWVLVVPDQRGCARAGFFRHAAQQAHAR